MRNIIQLKSNVCFAMYFFCFCVAGWHSSNRLHRNDLHVLISASPQQVWTWMGHLLPLICMFSIFPSCKSHKSFCKSTAARATFPSVVCLVLLPSESAHVDPADDIPEEMWGKWKQTKANLTQLLHKKREQKGGESRLFSEVIKATALTLWERQQACR